MDISVIIVSYNVRHYILQCVRSVFASASAAGISAEVFVVDNASHDGSPEFLRRAFPNDRYPTLHVVDNSRNVGFGRANNQVLPLATGEYVLYLNPDTLITEYTLRDCLGFARAHSELGALGVRMLRDDGAFAFESRRGLPSPWTSFCKMSGLAALFPTSRTFGRYYMRYLPVEEWAQVEVVSGAFMLIPRKALQECGPFDEDFFMYGEDIDLSYRLLKSGRCNYYLPTPILHYKGESTQKSSYRYVHVFYEAMLIFFEKHYRHYRFTLSVPVRIAIYMRAVVALMQQQLKRFHSFLRLGATPREVSYVFFGRAESIPIVEEIATKWCLNITAVDASTLPVEGYNPVMSEEAKGHYYVVYDLSCFCARRILADFMASDHTRKIGTFIPDARLLLTGQETYSL